MTRLWRNNSTDRLWRDNSTDRLWRDNLILDTVATPEADPLTGSYTFLQTIELSTLTAGADIYYTLDGTIPTEESILYTAPIPMFKGTLKIIGIKEGYLDSSIETFLYSILEDNVYCVAPDVIPYCISPTTDPFCVSSMPDPYCVAPLPDCCEIITCPCVPIECTCGSLECDCGFIPEPSPLPLGEMIAPLSKRSAPHIYTYLVNTGAIVKIDTKPSSTPTLPRVVDYLVINDDPSNYILDYNKSFGSTRGAYAISKDSYDKIWYLFKSESNGNVKLVEVDISAYPMSIMNTSIHTGILDYGSNEYFNDACAIDDYCFFPTNKITGRILRFDTDHVLLDQEFNYPQTGATDEPIRSITINPAVAEIAWMYNKHATTVKVPYASYSFIVRWTYSDQDVGVDSAQWQNFLRYDELYDHIFRQRIYWVDNGVAYYYSDWDQNIARNWVLNLEWMKQYLGGNTTYFYVISKDNSGGVVWLNRFTNQVSASAPLNQIRSVVTSYANTYSVESFNSIYNDYSDKSCMLRHNTVNDLNYIATFNSSLVNISDQVLDTIYWGE